MTVVSRRWPSGMARFHTTQRYFAPSSSFCGVIDRVLVVWRSFDPPRLIGACNGIALPSRYQLKISGEKNKQNSLCYHAFKINHYGSIWPKSIYLISLVLICLLTDVLCTVFGKWPIELFNIWSKSICHIVGDEIKMTGNQILNYWTMKTYVMPGSGLPPMELHVKSNFLSSVAVAIVPGATIGGCGGVKIVIL